MAIVLMLVAISGSSFVCLTNAELQRKLNDEQLKSEKLLSEKLQLEKEINELKVKLQKLGAKEGLGASTVKAR